jgi:LytS/YehU family sensor histidine kinase
MHRDVEAADAMLARLGELLRHTLQEGDRHEVPLREELELLEHYLAIMRVRFQDRLTVVTEAAPETLDALVPHFVLQPLVENALQHGIARRPGAGRVEIRAERVGGELRLSVTDDGPGLTARGGGHAFPREGVGLSNTRARLRQLYGDAQHLSLEPRKGGSGLRVTLVIPFRAADSRGELQQRATDATDATDAARGGAPPLTGAARRNATDVAAGARGPNTETDKSVSSVQSTAGAVAVPSAQAAAGRG